MLNTGLIAATAPRIFRIGSKTPDKFGARIGFFHSAGTDQAASDGSTDNGSTILGNMQNPTVVINGVTHRIFQVSTFTTVTSFVMENPSHSLGQTDITSITTRNGTLTTSSANSFQNSTVNSIAVSTWSWQIGTNDVSITAVTNTNPTANYTTKVFAFDQLEVTI